MFGMKWHLCKDISFLISVHIVAVICIIAAQQLEEYCMHTISKHSVGYD